MIIVGAGLSGLLAATQFQTAQVYEASPINTTSHRALLRFRSSAVGDAVGIEFRKVRVHKGIWRDGRHIAPSIKVANQYSQKVLGRLGDRSIWHLDPVDRFIAPDNLMEQLIERVGSRIEWETPLQFTPTTETNKLVSMPAYNSEKLQPMMLLDAPVIWTAPMSVLVKQLELKQHPHFTYSPIHVSRYKVESADVFQTIYFPSPETDVYRASITGDTLIIEAMDAPTHKDYCDVLDAFGIDQVSANLGVSEQRYGKIAPIDDAWRRNFIVEATRRLNVYSLGRFAVWKNILADDVLKDISVIKRLLKGDAYGQSIVSSGNLT